MPSIIRPSDFTVAGSTNQAPTEWSVAILKRVLPFLDGVRVIVVTDRGTGHAVEGYIVGLHDSTASSNYPHIAMGDEPDDTTKRLHRLSDMGEIVVLGESNARWNAATAIRNETYDALKAVQQFIGTDFPPGAPYKGARRWTFTLTPDGVRVAWGESYRDRRWFVDTNRNVRLYA